jgi:hypothetical protein
MKTTPEKLVELKAMAEHARSHFCIELAEAFVRAVPDLIADLEEAQEQLASPYMDGYEAAKDSLLMDALPFVSQLVTSDTIAAEIHDTVFCCETNTSALDAAIAEAIEPYRKDAACWRFARKNLLWREVGDDHIRWSMELAMPEPDLECGILSNDSVARELDAAVLAAIAARGESE